MSDTKNDAKNGTLAMKLSLNKETLRIIDDSQLEVLDAVVGGGRAADDGCVCTAPAGGCGTSAVTGEDAPQ